MERNIYLKMHSVEEAIELAKEKISIKLKTEQIQSHKALGRVSAKPIYAKYSSPSFHSAAMDGVAVSAEKTFSARETNPILLKEGTDFIPVNTGNPMPPNTNSVIMIENIVYENDKTIKIEAPIHPWKNVRRIGEDIVATELLFSSNHSFNAYDVAALLTAGIWEVEVFEKIKISFIPTGNEVLDFEDKPEMRIGAVIESNSQLFKGIVENLGLEVKCLKTIQDDFNLLYDAVKKEVDSGSHIVVLGAGSSAGSKDYSYSVFEKLGKVFVYGISIMPGKPTILAEASGVLLFGAPGYPVSLMVSVENLLKPIISYVSKRNFFDREVLNAKLNARHHSKIGMEEVLRLSLAKIGENYFATPLQKGAGLITSLTKAQAITKIAKDLSGLEEGENIKVELLCPKKEIDSVLMHIGSHDNSLDLISNMLMQIDKPIYFVSNHKGSMGGLRALSNKSTHLAGTHLFDPITNDFNFPFLKKFFPNLKLTLFNLAIRHQGIIVAKANPKKIQGIKDLTNPNVKFINRQKGAGTRILLDYHLEKEKIKPEEIKGYDQEEYTHMAVAVNVLTNTTDCGLGIYAAAKALNLDFIPVAKERYDIAIPDEFLNLEKIQKFLEIINSNKFKEKLSLLGGYETPLTGQVMKGRG